MSVLIRLVYNVYNEAYLYVPGCYVLVMRYERRQLIRYNLGIQA